MLCHQFAIAVSTRLGLGGPAEIKAVMALKGLNRSRG